VLRFYCNPDKWDYYRSNQKQSFQLASARACLRVLSVCSHYYRLAHAFAPLKSLAAVKGYIERSYEKYRAIRTSRVNHTGGGDGEQLENGIAASLKLGSGEIKKYSEAVVKAFEANGFYDLFDAW